MVLGEGLGRLVGNPEIETEHLTAVAVAGFCVNLIGLCSEKICLPFLTMTVLVFVNVLITSCISTCTQASPGLFAFHDLAHSHGGSTDHHATGHDEENGHAHDAAGHQHDGDCCQLDHGSARGAEASKKTVACNHSSNSNMAGVSSCNVQQPQRIMC